MAPIKWSQSNPEGTVQAFLARNPPSKTFDVGGGNGWIWVCSNRDGEVEDGSSSKQLEEAKKALDDLVQRYEEIEVSLFTSTGSQRN
jgi:hypothetical protein